MKDELVNMYIIYKKERQIIQMIMDGVYTDGFKSFNIPKKDIPKWPEGKVFKK